MVQFFGVQKLADFFHICPQYSQIVRKGKGRNNRPNQPSEKITMDRKVESSRLPESQNAKPQGSTQISTEGRMAL